MFSFSVALLMLYVVQWTKSLSPKDLRYVHPDNQSQLVKLLRRKGYIKTERVAEVMKKVDRDHYTEYFPYEDDPQDIGYGASISAPHVHAYALEILQGHLKEGSRALDVGCGSGYVTACMAFMVGDTGFVVGVEHVKYLSFFSKINIVNSNEELMAKKLVRIIEGNGKIGYPEYAPFDVIHVGAAAEEVPSALIKQLKIGGRMLIPIGRKDEYHTMTIIDKHSDGSITKNESKSLFRFLPLTDEHHFKDELY